MEQFNPALENLVYLGNNYLRAFHGECQALQALKTPTTHTSLCHPDAATEPTAIPRPPLHPQPGTLTCPTSSHLQPDLTTHSAPVQTAPISPISQQLPHPQS